MADTLRDFVVQLKRESQRTKYAVSKLVILVSTSALRGVVMKTRVKTGRARGNWKVTFDAPTRSFGQNRFDKQGDATIARAGKHFTSLLADPYRRVFIANAVPYIGIINDTYGDKMIERTYGELITAMPAFIAEAER